MIKSYVYDFMHAEDHYGQEDFNYPRSEKE